MLKFLMKHAPFLRGPVKRFLLWRYDHTKHGPDSWVMRWFVTIRVAEYDGPHDVIIAGDSVVAAVEPALEAIPGKDIRVTAWPGLKLSDLKENFFQLIRIYNPKSIRFDGGGNDFLSGRDPDLIYEDLRWVVAMAKSFCKDVAWINIVPLRGHDELNEATGKFNQRVATSGLVRVVDIRTPLSDETGRLREDCAAPDGIHNLPPAIPVWVKTIGGSL